VKDPNRPIGPLQNFWESNPDDDKILKEIKGLQDRMQWNDQKLMRAIFASLFPGGDIKKDFYKKTAVLYLFTQGNVKNQRLVLHFLELMITRQKELLKELNSILYGFWYDGVLDEEVIIKWVASPNKKVDRNMSQAMRTACKEFIEWLDDANSEEDDDPLFASKR